MSQYTLISFRRRVVASHDAFGQPIPAHERARSPSANVAEAVEWTAQHTYCAVEDDTEEDRTGRVAAI